MVGVGLDSAQPSRPIQGSTYGPKVLIDFFLEPERPFFSGPLFLGRCEKVRPDADRTVLLATCLHRRLRSMLKQMLHACHARGRRARRKYGNHLLHSGSQHPLSSLQGDSLGYPMRITGS